jgi:hypothetical protein
MISGNLFPHVRDDPAEHARSNNEKIVLPDAAGREQTDLCISGRASEQATVGINKNARTVPEKHAGDTKRKWRIHPANWRRSARVPTEPAAAESAADIAARRRGRVTRKQGVIGAERGARRVEKARR